MLETAGWRFFPQGDAPANVRLEAGVTLKATDLDALGENFEKASKGFIDFLLLNEKGFPFIVLEAKAEDKSPLVGKEQARKYAPSQNCRFVLLSSGNLKLFLCTGNAVRARFLVNRLELEDQALKAFKKVLANDYKRVLYKENCDDGRHAEIVVMTVQSLFFNNKYQSLFSPTDFDLGYLRRSAAGHARLGRHGPAAARGRGSDLASPQQACRRGTNRPDHAHEKGRRECSRRPFFRFARAPSC